MFHHPTNLLLLVCRNYLTLFPFGFTLFAYMQVSKSPQQKNLGGDVWSLCHRCHLSFGSLNGDIKIWIGKDLLNDLVQPTASLHSCIIYI